VDSSILSAYSTIDRGSPFMYSSYPATPKTWAAKYGYEGFTYMDTPYFIVGDVTGYENGSGTEADPTRLRLSGRNLLYISPGYYDYDAEEYVPGSMGYYNFEYQSEILAGYGGYGGSSGIFEQAPTALSGYWGYDESYGLNCLLANNGGYAMHVGDEWGALGSWSAPWNGPAAVKMAGRYFMDYGYGGYEVYDGFGGEMDTSDRSYLWHSPVSSSGYGGDNPFYISGSDPKFTGFTMGRIGKLARTNSGTWEKAAKGALAAIYTREVNDPNSEGTYVEAGLLTTFSPGSAAGGLTGGFYPDGEGYGGYWQLEGTWTATPMTTGSGYSDFSLREMYYYVAAGYGTGDTYIRGSGESTALYFSALQADLDRRVDLPFGTYAITLDGDGGGTHDFGFRSASGKASDLSGKDIKIAGVSGYGPAISYWKGAVKNTLWTPTTAAVLPDSGEIMPAGATGTPESGEIEGVVSGDYLSLTQIGTFGGPFAGLYDEAYAGAGYGYWIGGGVGTFTGQDLAFSSRITGNSYKAILGGEGAPSFQTTGFEGIMGGLSADLWVKKTSPIRLMGRLNGPNSDPPLPISPSLSASEIRSYIPKTSSFTGAYRGFLGASVDAANRLSGSVMALYQEGYGGYGGVLYSNDIAGTVDPETGFWEAKEGNLFAYNDLSSVQLWNDPGSFAASLIRYEYENIYDSGAVGVDVISGGRVDPRQSQVAIDRINGESWGIWNGVSGGTYTGATPRSWISSEVNTPLPSAAWTGGYGSQYLSYQMDTPVGEISQATAIQGTVAGAQVVWYATSVQEPDPRAYTVVMGGTVKGLFDPNTAVKSWTTISQGGFMETSAFLNKLSTMDAAARANFEKTMKIPAFDVGMGNLRGSSGDFSVNIDNIKFFAFQGVKNPSIFASDAVNGTFGNAETNYTGTQVLVSGSGGLSGILKQNFDVTQWGNNSWSGNISSGASGQPGPLQLTGGPGAGTSVLITEMKGGAAGTINTSAKTFSGTAAGTVR
jgi:hypothetical protein